MRFIDDYRVRVSYALTSHWPEMGVPCLAPMKSIQAGFFQSRLTLITLKGSIGRSSRSRIRGATLKHGRTGH